MNFIERCADVVPPKKVCLGFGFGSRPQCLNFLGLEIFLKFFRPKSFKHLLISIPKSIVSIELRELR